MRSVPAAYGGEPSRPAESDAERITRYAALRLEKEKKLREKEAIKARLAEDRSDYRRYRPDSDSASEAASSSAAGASSFHAPPEADPSQTTEADPSQTTELRVRCEDGSVMRCTLGASEPLQRVADLVAEQRAADAAPFVLRVPFPSIEYGTPQQLQTPLLAAGLVPRGTLLVLSLESKGVVRRAPAQAATGSGAMQGQFAQMEQMLANMGALQGAQANDYESLLELQASVGEVTHGLSLAELSSLPVSELHESPEEERRCCICCCEFVQKDKVMRLACGHDYHLECIATWLRSKRVCPICKQPAVKGE